MNDSELIWHEKSRTEVFRTPVFTVTERTSESPDGRRGIYIVNEAPDWVIVIPDTGETFLMVRQWRHGEKALSIEFPGGVIDKGEAPLEAAKRELMEETGASAGKLTFLGSMNPNPALFSNHVHVFLAEDLKFSGKQDLDEDEYVNYMPVLKSEVLKKIGSWEYCHALMASAAALYMAAKI
ncbi:NUDIX hydrolase [Treponema sp.]|uniref:NUDIX hydrolase n=1 Tax=Treponema sp. TaxID=166 RepID=UPI003F0C08CD